MTKEQIQGLITLTNFPATGLWEMANQYWPRCADYAKTIIESPWWLVRTPWGMVTVGWRKRVISIDWSDTPLSLIVTKDDVTKDNNSVHAWSIDDAVKYMGVIARALEALPVPPVKLTEAMQAAAREAAANAEREDVAAATRRGQPGYRIYG